MADRLPSHRSTTLGPHWPPRTDSAASADEPPFEAVVSVAGMPADAKRALWQHLKTEHPERAAFFDDPVVKELLAAGAVPAFPTEIVRAALRKQRS